MSDWDTVRVAAAQLVDACRRRGLKVAVAESCTGGLIAAALTDPPGASAVFDRGFVTYSNAAKTELLGVPAGLIDRQGAVSEPVAAAMAEGALARSRADLAVAVTGIAGPGGGSATKPVGLVHFAVARRGKRTAPQVREYGDVGRGQVRLLAAGEAITLLRSAAES